MGCLLSRALPILQEMLGLDDLEVGGAYIYILRGLAVCTTRRPCRGGSELVASSAGDRRREMGSVCLACVHEAAIVVFEVASSCPERVGVHQKLCLYFRYREGMCHFPVASINSVTSVNRDYAPRGQKDDYQHPPVR